MRTNRLRLKRRDNPEARVQKAIIEYLKARYWLVREMHAGARMMGWPDLWASHVKHGQRWIEVKLPDMKKSKWTDAQKIWFPKMVEAGTPLWIMTEASEKQYMWLFSKKQGNYHEFLLLKG